MANTGRNEPAPESAPLLSAKSDENASAAGGRPPVAFSLQLRGYVLIGVAAIILSLRATGIHAILSRTPVPAITSLLTQAISYTVLSGLVMAWNGINPRELSRKSVLQLCLRGLLSGVMIFFNLLTLQNISVGTALTLFAMAPAIATVLSFVFLREGIFPMEGLFLVVNMVGVYFVASPTSITPEVSEGQKLLSPKIGLACAFICAFLQASIFTLVRAMGNRVHYSLNVLASGIGCILGFALLADAQSLALIRENVLGFAGLQIISLFNFLSQAFLNYSMQFVRPGPALIVRSLNVPMSFLLGFFFLQEQPTLLEAFGVCLVLGSVIYIGTSRK